MPEVVLMSPGQAHKAKADPRSEAKNGSRVQSICHALRSAILEQALRPGMKLPEDTIGEQFGVSRTLVREALKRLAVEGLIEIKLNRGASVAYPTLDEARDVFEVRRMLERLVVQSLAGRLSQAQIMLLETCIQNEDDARDRNGPESIRLAGEFHTLLSGMTGNVLLDRYVLEVCSRCSLILALYGRPHSSECAVNEHRQLVDALRQGDADKAMALMDRHLEDVAARAALAPRGSGDIRDLLAPYALKQGLAK
jgi:DNA-binding GntR family transcriptional regulator